MTFQAAATLWHRTNVARYKGATAVKYENLLRSHILPELGARQLEEINTLLLADFMNAKLHCGRLDHSGGLSSSYVRSMMLLVLDIMEFAAAEGLCPPVKTTLQTPAVNRREVVILDTDALRRLETYLLAKPDITGTGILISLHTGLRISEVCALRWEDAVQRRIPPRDHGGGDICLSEPDGDDRCRWDAAQYGGADRAEQAAPGA